MQAGHWPGRPKPLVRAVAGPRQIGRPPPAARQQRCHPRFPGQPSAAGWPAGSAGRHAARCEAGGEQEQPSSSGSGGGGEGHHRHGVPLPSPNSHREDHNSSWAHLLMALPLEVAAAGARTNATWLKKRKRSRWWSRQEFPRVPADSLKDIEANLPEPVTLWQKAAPLALIFFCASFNLTILQNLRDALIVTAAGAETLPFLASLGVLPASLAFLSLYGRLVERLPATAVFYAAIAPLVAFYALFATVLYPAAAWLHPHGMYARLAPAVPVGLHGLLKMVENWLYSLFFCAGELWGGVVISVLFWSLANEVCSVSDAKTVYPLMGIAANVALVVAGNYMKWVNATLTQGSMLLSLRFLVGTVVALTALMMAAKRYVDVNICVPVAARGGGAPAKGSPAGGKRRRKGSLGDSLSVLRRSPMIMNLALLVMSYGVSHRLFEFAWKGQLRQLYPSAQAYQGMLADVSIATGYVTIALMLTGRFVFQYLGWKVAALATPAVMLLTGGAFFGLSLTGGNGSAAANLAAAGALAGAVTQVFARSSKFSLFDPAKEMVYIEMGKEEKSRGKAAVDLVGSQIGKSGASWITQAVLLITGSLAAALPVIAAVYGAVIAAWLLAVRKLGQQMEEHDKFQHLQRKEEKRLKREQLAAVEALAAGPDSGESSGDEAPPPSPLANGRANGKPPQNGAGGSGVGSPAQGRPALG